MALEMVLEGSFSGAGNTIPPMIISIPGSVLRVPLAYLIAIFGGRRKRRVVGDHSHYYR
jgi:Na+-driven multidrug efflux pump